MPSSISGVLFLEQCSLYGCGNRAKWSVKVQGSVSIDSVQYCAKHIITQEKRIKIIEKHVIQYSNKDVKL